MTEHQGLLMFASTPFNKVLRLAFGASLGLLLAETDQLRSMGRIFHHQSCVAIRLNPKTDPFCGTAIPDGEPAGWRYGIAVQLARRFKPGHDTAGVCVFSLVIPPDGQGSSFCFCRYCHY